MQLPVFDEVRDHLVSPDHPARDEGDLDYERCAALHNAIVKYAWTASGRSLEDLPLITCWEADVDEWELDLDRLHSSMVEFLKRAYSTELPETELLHNGTSTEYKFFYFLEGLVSPHGHETPAYNYDDFEDYPGQYMTLYTPNDRLGSHPFGLVYDQETHECVINFENIWFEPTDRALPWQRLETVLSVYIDMIESEKVVCIRDDVEQSGDIKRVVVDGDIKWLDTRDRPDAMLADLVTGVKRNRGVMFGPWIVQPYTKAVLERCLQIWDSLIQAIEDRMLRPLDNDTIVEYGLANEQMLDLAGVTKEFTKQILLRARRPRFTFIAPGLRLPTLEEFTEQPFKGIMTMHNDPRTRQTMPALILRGDDSCKASKHFPHPYEGATSVPTGLYLADCTPSDLVYFEDAARLLLPFSIGGEDTWAQTANCIAMDGEHDILYQIGENPFAPYHNVSLLGILQNFYAHVQTGSWSVDERGVSNSIDKFRDAETEEYCRDYVVPLGPGGYW